VKNQRKNKKVLYFDNWDKGYRNFLRLDVKFKEKGYDTILLHTSSLIDKDVVAEKQIEGLKLRDISYYRTKRLKKMILKENPSIIIMLNISFIIDRAIVKICKDLNISVFHLSHGKLIPKESIDIVKSAVKKSSKGNLLSKISKKNIFAGYNYFIELKSIKKIASFFIKAVKNPMEYTLFPKFSSELEVKKSLVYYPSDYDIMINEFGFPKDMVKVVGNPELDIFYNSIIIDRELFLSEYLGTISNKYIAYIDDGLALIYGWDTNKWLLFLKDLNETLKSKELKLVIKLHPRREITDCIDFFEENDIKYFYDIDFKNFIHHSLFVVSHFSSVIVYALLLNKKVKSPRWGLSNGLEEKYPQGVVYYYYDKQDFKESIFNLEVETGLIQKFLLDSVGEVNGTSIDKIINTVLNEV